MIDLYFFQLSVPYLWLALGIIIASTEFMFPTQLSMWSGAAAFIVGLLCLIGAIPYHSFYVQIFVFSILTVVFLLLWFFVAKKYFKFAKTMVAASRDDTLTGIKGKVSLTILPGKPGEITLYSSYHGISQWKAESDILIEEGTDIEVVEGRGNHVLVKPVS